MGHHRPPRTARRPWPLRRPPQGRRPPQPRQRARPPRQLTTTPPTESNSRRLREPRPAERREPATKETPTETESPQKISTLIAASNQATTRLCNCMSVRTAAKLLSRWLIFKCMCESTQERSPTIASSVAKASLSLVIWRITCDFMTESNRFNATSVLRGSPNQDTSMGTSKSNMKVAVLIGRDLISVRNATNVSYNNSIWTII